MGSQDGGNQLFDDEAGTSHHAEVAANIDNSSSFLNNFDQKEEKKVERQKMNDGVFDNDKVHEEEKVAGGQSQNRKRAEDDGPISQRLSLRALLNDIQIYPQKQSIFQNNKASQKDSSLNNNDQRALDNQLNRTNDEAQQPPNAEDIEELNQMKKLAIDVLKLMWQYCMEDMVTQSQPLAPNMTGPGFGQHVGSSMHTGATQPEDAAAQKNQQEANADQLNQNDDNFSSYLFDNQRTGTTGGVVSALPHQRGYLSMQNHSAAIENLCQILNYHFPMSSFFFMNLCVQNLKRNKSVISSQTILQKLIEGMAFPISLPERKRTQKDKSSSI